MTLINTNANAGINHPPGAQPVRMPSSRRHSSRDGDGPADEPSQRLKWDEANLYLAEQDRTAGERDRLIREPGYVSTAYDWYGYRARGQYLDHLDGWLDRFDRRQLLILPSEQLYRSPAATYGQVLDFLGLPSFTPSSFEAHNHRRSAPMDDGLRADGTVRTHCASSSVSTAGAVAAGCARSTTR